jgi:hypothetical protein
MDTGGIGKRPAPVAVARLTGERARLLPLRIHTHAPVPVSCPTNLGSADVRWSAVQRVLMQAYACRWLPVAATPAS